jgi:hypothetical protein
VERRRFVQDLAAMGVAARVAPRAALAADDEPTSRRIPRWRGWALWSLRGDFGVLDSNRADVQYEDYRGHNTRPRDARAAAQQLSRRIRW